MQWNDLGDNHRSARIDRSRANSSNGTTDDEGSGIGGCAAYDRSDLEDENRQQTDILGVVKGVDATPEQLRCAARDEVGTGIPGDVVEGMELICDPWDGCRNNCTILFAVSEIFTKKRFLGKELTKATRNREAMTEVMIKANFIP